MNLSRHNNYLMARSNHGKKQGKSQQKDALERKRDERTVRSAYRKKKKEESYLAEDENFASFSNQLQIIGLKLRDIPGDGNCLFRALGDQVDGHSRNHLKHRAEAVQYIREHRDFFEPFMEDNISFDKHISDLSNSGTYGGNDSIVAFARRQNVDVVIHQLNSPVWKVSGSDGPNARELHIAYHNGDHYSSVRKMSDNDNNPTNFRSLQVTKPSQGVSQSSTKKGSRKPANADTASASNYPQCNVTDKDSVSDLVLYVMQQSGCQDVEQVKEVLEENFYDPEAAISYLLQLEELSERLEPRDSEGKVDDGNASSEGCGAGSELWSEGGTANRLFGDLENEATVAKTEPNRTGTGSDEHSKGTQVNSRMNGRQKKQKAKLEKQQRKMEKNRQKFLDKKGAEKVDDDVAEVKGATVVLAGEMGALSI
ncbi:OTU domain-containing protein 3-like isoform X2 [Apostichopus japonicus]|uniref:OTU domain-containing protein 3-like isoform X2 n=1 Tax=Stichopus japonicus TaxID=307972 RepID=UPI003AB6459C